MQITATGIDHIISIVKKYEDAEAKVNEVAEQLCKIGKPIVDRVHGHHAKVQTDRVGKNELRINADGTDVLFIEFGAGDEAGRDKGLYDDVPSVVYPGSWSETHAQEYSTKGYWEFPEGHRITKVSPTPALYYAYEYMIQNFPDVVKDVFR